MLTIGSMCSGYGGLDLAVEAILGPARHAWHCEVDPDASAVLAAHWPDTPNHCDLTAVDWSQVEPIDILTAGFPCQDVSAAGLRAGIAPGTRSGLWTHIAHIIHTLQPRLVVIENVRGLLSARADRNLGPEHEDMETTGRDALRAAGAVCGDLANLGYDTSWATLAASDIGAPHRRERVFILAWPTADPYRVPVWQQPVTEPGGCGAPLAGDAGTPAGGVDLLPTPTARDARRGAGWGNQPGRPLSETVMRLVPPLVPSVALGVGNRATGGTQGGPNQRGSSGDLMLPSAVVQLLPTPTVQHHARNATATRTAPKVSTNTSGWTLSDVAYADRWGAYTSAITRWERITNREAPSPTEPGRTGQPRLSPRFVEWMMGLPAGWVTDHVGRNPALKALGNGVVWQQGAAAIQHLLATIPA